MGGASRPNTDSRRMTLHAEELATGVFWLGLPRIQSMISRRSQNPSRFSIYLEGPAGMMVWLPFAKQMALSVML